MKKYIITGSIVLILLISGFFVYRYLRVKYAKVEITLKEDMTTEFLSAVKVSDFIVDLNGEIIDDYEIDTTTVGKQKIKFIIKIQNTRYYKEKLNRNFHNSCHDLCEYTSLHA